MYVKRKDLLDISIKEERFVLRTEDLLNNEVVIQTVYKDLAEVVSSLPSADVEEVVRCKNCIFGRKSDKAIFCSEYKRLKLPTDFCSYGKHKLGVRL